MTRGGEAPSLTLAVQFASVSPVPTRDRVRRWVRAAIAGMARPADRYALTVRFVDAVEGRALNRAYRGRDYATNVLTFAYSHGDADGDANGDVRDAANDDANGDVRDAANDDANDDVTDAAAVDAVEADIVVCVPVVEREAREQRKDVMDHCAHLVVHGTLHAAGFDHEAPDDAEAMEAVERRVLRRFRIADPYA